MLEAIWIPTLCLSNSLGIPLTERMKGALDDPFDLERGGL
jgi:hypothetical protein